MKTCFTYLFLLLAAVLRAQIKIDSVIILPEVEKICNAVNVTAQSPITSYKFIGDKNLNVVLRMNTGLYLKNYGNGQLASITIRGTSAAQTDVLWNGVKLNSPSLGQVDFSLFNMSMSDRLEYNGISKYGNVGGYINLINDTRIDSGFSLKANISYGSFNTIRTSGDAKYNTGRFSGATRISYLSSDNNYLYINTTKSGNPKQKLTNAKVQSLNVMQQFNARVNQQNDIRFSVWLSDAQRRIPSVIRTQSKESQDDYSLRSALAWQGSFRKFSTQFTSAFLHDVIHYHNPEIHLNEKSIIQTLRNSFSFSYDSLKRFSVYAEVGYDFERATVPSYILVRTRHIGKFSASAKYKPVKDFSVQFDIRESIYDKTFSPFSAALSLSYQKYFTNHVVGVWTKAARNFRFPTLNDLYWADVGNPNLKTEKSLDGEAGLQYGYKNRLYFLAKATGFCKYIDQWIQWIPTGTNWMPQNIKRVLSRGAEVSLRLEGPFGFNRNFNFALQMNYTYTRATNLVAISVADQSKGKQLIYVPLHIANTLLHLEYKKFYLRATNIYSDVVFTSTDNRDILMGYYLLDIEIGKDFVISNFEIGAAFRVNNVTGGQYYNVVQRPMPGRNFEGTLRFKIAK